jgi:hypothetical protein
LGSKHQFTIDLLAKLIIQQNYLKKFTYNYISLYAALDVTNTTMALNNVHKSLSVVEFTKCQFTNERDLLEFSFLRDFKIVLKNCIILHKDLNYYEDIGNNFINKYFNYIPHKFTAINFDENKDRNMIIIIITLRRIYEIKRNPSGIYRNIKFFPKMSNEQGVKCLVHHCEISCNLIFKYSD